MKRLLFVFSALMLVLMLVACAGGDGENQGAESNNENQPEAPTGFDSDAGSRAGL